jgi:hypothetical protein
MTRSNEETSTVLRTVIEADAHAHHPDDPDDERWQESFCIVWHDPLTGSGGNHHFSLWRNQGIADVWSWCVIEGIELGREQENALSIPDADMFDVTVGGMTVTTEGDLQHYVLRHVYAGCTVEVRFEAWCPPIELDYAKGGTQLGKRHYETLGGVEVDVQLPERRLSLTGVAFQDHSWGTRLLGRNPGGQFIFAVFGRDLMTVVYSRITVDGLDQDGWLSRGGDVRRVRRADIRADVGIDGLVGRRCTCDVWTDQGSGMRINGTLQAGAVEGGIGLLAGDGLMVFESGGRLGGGLLELKPLRFPLPAHRALLNLPDDEMVSSPG